MSATIDLAALLEVIADHPVLPPPGSLPPDSEELRAVLGEIARGSRSAHAALIRQVASARHVGFEELVRRAGFVLACVTLPSSGTHYELLGISPKASSREIRQRWATLIQRYHPDHAGPEGGLGDQARRLIEAYQTLRDPDRRRRYDAELSRARGGWPVVSPVNAPGSWRKLTPAGRWRWAPAAIAAVGVVVVVAMVRWTAHPPTMAPRAAPRPAEPAMSEVIPADPGPVHPPRSASNSGIDAGSAQPESPPAPSASRPSLPSLLRRLTVVEPTAAPSLGDAGTAGEAARENDRAEPITGDASKPPPGTPRTVVEPPAPPPATPDAAHGAHRPGPDVGVPPSASAPKPTPHVMVTPAPSAPERRPPATPAPPVASAPALAPTRANKKAPAPEGWSSLIEAFRGAYERKDVAVLNGLFADDVRERTAVGRRAVQQLYMANFQVLDDIRYEVSQMTAQPGPREGEVLVRGRFRIRAVDARNGARPLDVSGPIHWTLRREGEALRIVGIDYDAGRR